MGLYTSFNPSDYYEPEYKKKETKPSKAVEQKQTPPKLTESQRKSLYAEAQKVKEKIAKDKKGPNFKKKFRVGQKVAIKNNKNEIVTRNGIILEIVAEDLMYVSMLDTYKDVNDQWLVAFVTHDDTIYPL